ncbi:Metallothiol transferase FosB protein [Marine Group I thaumarchaeote SCGC AAA799-E16]|uniref:Metallothiol transferase FosB protein n=5 Tax=Marine Group I TaxID=905826 RepID=A0A087S7X6_9ARCH|nr:Metallothiol transferase FosB protein [Marine Group I thaumarchaeote SCGC AAA799-N04]KER05825.1 Metallothiol transferase FosB protein [Marine Group I thaumarchaeote SCGC AAA799-E16]KFM17016.1 Metallothiol transferase FosB protein [Marine Group I thaumarchaeote SCGC AAA799-D11]KFM19117.1 Metallothiol transferase FosB protein [Marine Group I thaumarchaeote SCGC RSA3]KFM21830.1 Metallothiol transferase FosB protein [Marine Group I thaumarchaeote SCGC AAA799-B03]
MTNTLKATSMDHVNMNVRDLSKTVEFYKNLFGFEVRKEDNSPNKLDAPSKIIGNDSIKLCLYEDPQVTPTGGIAHFGFHVENFEDIIQKCNELGVEVLYDGPVDFEKSRSVYIKDPTGYDIELSEVSGGGL